MKQTLDGDAGARQGAVLLPPGQGGSWQEGGSGGRQSLSCLSVSLPALPQAAILQQTAEYIFSLEQEKTRLLQQNTQLKRFIQVVSTCVPRGWDGMGRNGMGGEGTVLAGRGGDMVTVPWSQGKTLCPNKPGDGDVSHPPGWAGEPHSTRHPSPGMGRTVVPFSIWGIRVWPGGSSGSVMVRFNRSGCHSVRSGFAQGWGCEDQEGRQAQGARAHPSLDVDPMCCQCPQGVPSLQGAVFGGGRGVGVTQTWSG